MRRVKLAVVIVVVLAFALFSWQLRSSREGLPTDTPAPQPVAPDAKAIDERALEPEAAGAEQVALVESRELAHAEASVPSTKQETLTLFGRTIDQDDHPLAGVNVRLQGFKVWADGVDVPRLSIKADYRGFEVATDAQGRFRFDVVKPTVSAVVLLIEPDPFHESARLTFGGTREYSRPPILSVGQDLGDIRLSATGAIRGVVRDSAGAPVADAELSASTRHRRFGDGTSDASGAYTILHLPRGVQSVDIRREGFLYQIRHSVEVRCGEYTDGVDFTLMPAPSLRGIVVDEAGAPLEGARLRGSSESGSFAAATSASDGTFTMFLPKDEPHTLEATKEGFAPYHYREFSHTFFAPGTSDLRVEMVRSTNFELFVVDAATERPIESYGVRVGLNESVRSPLRQFSASRTLKAETHAGGIALVGMRPGLDVIFVSAPGFVDRRVDPEPELPADARIVARMSAGTAVIGRLMIGGAPAPRRGLSLETQSTLLSSRSTDSDEEGRFRFEAVAPERYWLALPHSESLVIDRTAFKVESSLVDLGDVALTPGAVLSGRVLVPAKRSALGLKVRLDGAYNGAKFTTNSDGRFRFEGLSAGVHTLSLEEVPGSIGSPPPLDVELKAGEHRDVVYDVGDSGTCQVSLKVLVNSLPAANLDVELISPAKGSVRGPSWRLDSAGRGADFFLLGRTDANGRVSGWAPACGPSRVGVRFGVGPAREHPSVELALELDARIEAIVSFNNGRLVVILLEQVALPEQGVVTAVLRRDAQPAFVSTSGALVTASSPSRNFAFDQVFAGEFELVVTLTEIVNGVGRAVLFESSQPVVIRQGETTEVRLR